MSAQDIWKNMPKEENPMGRAPSIINGEKKTLTKSNLKMYVNSTPIEDINKDTFLDFFDASTLDKVIPSTTLYLPHLIFHAYYTDEQILALTNFIFELVSCHLLTTGTGMNYLQCIFNRPEALREDTVKKLLDQGMEIGANFDHRDENWNTVLEWALVGNGYPGAISDIYPYMPPSFHPNIKDGSYYDFNRDELLFTDLAEITLGKIYFNYDAESEVYDKYKTIRRYQNRYKNYKNSNNSYLLKVLCSHTNNFYLRCHLKPYAFDEISCWSKELADFAGVFKKTKLNTMGSYWKDKEKEKILVKE